jgi:hypothetical protein
MSAIVHEQIRRPTSRIRLPTVLIHRRSTGTASSRRSPRGRGREGEERGGKERKGGEGNAVAAGGERRRLRAEAGRSVREGGEE